MGNTLGVMFFLFNNWMLRSYAWILIKATKIIMLAVETHFIDYFTLCDYRFWLNGGFYDTAGLK